MRRYLDTFFRYWLVVLLPVIILPVAEYALSGRSTNTISAHTNIFVQQTIDSSAAYSSQPLTPAQSEQSYLSQWLQSPSFGQRVASKSPLLTQHLQPMVNLGDAAAADLTKNVQITATGDNLLTISYTNPDGTLDVQVVGALLRAIRDNENALRQQQATLGVQYYTAQLQAAQQREQQSAQQLTTYMKAHNIKSSQLLAATGSDLTLDNLYQQNRIDQNAVSTARQNLLNYSNQESIPATIPDLGSFTEVDPPSLTISVPGHSKAFLLLAVALLIGLLFSGAFVVTMTALDRTVRFADEVPALLDLPVLAVLPYTPRQARQRLIGESPSPRDPHNAQASKQWRLG